MHSLECSDEIEAYVAIDFQIWYDRYQYVLLDSTQSNGSSTCPDTLSKLLPASLTPSPEAGWNLRPHSVTNCNLSDLITVLDAPVSYSARMRNPPIPTLPTNAAHRVVPGSDWSLVRAPPQRCSVALLSVRQSIARFWPGEQLVADRLVLLYRHFLGLFHGFVGIEPV